MHTVGNRIILQTYSETHTQKMVIMTYSHYPVLLIENRYCKIYECRGDWYRYDKITSKVMPTNMYFDHSGNLIKNH